MNNNTFFLNFSRYWKPQYWHCRQVKKQCIVSANNVYKREQNAKKEYEYTFTLENQKNDQIRNYR